MPVVIREIDPGSALETGIGGDIDVIAYEISGLDAAPRKDTFTALIPGSIGDPSPYAPNAILVRKRFGGILGQQPVAQGGEGAGSWSALGYAFYKSNNPFSGGPRPYAAYARRLQSLTIPVFRQRTTVDKDGNVAVKYNAEFVERVRPISSRVKVKFIAGVDEDQFSEAVDPQVGRVFTFQNGGQPYILVGADGTVAPGAPLRAEYRFITSSYVPSFIVNGALKNIVFIPALDPLMEWVWYVPDNQDYKPVVTVAETADLYLPGDLADLPGF